MPGPYLVYDMPRGGRRSFGEGAGREQTESREKEGEEEGSSGRWNAVLSND